MIVLNFKQNKAHLENLGGLFILQINLINL